jgi:hypothetical protein
MNWRIVCFLAIVKLSLSLAIADESEQKSTSTPRQSSLEMQRLFNAFLGTWQVSEKIEPSEAMPNGGAGEGTEVYRAGPGGVSIIEEIHLKQTTGEISGLGVGWWDQQAHGYRAVWCDSENPSDCILMAHLAKWKGDQFVLRDEFERNGKKFDFKEVFSEITPTSFTQTLYQGERGKELKRLLTIHATKSDKSP